MSLFDRVLDAIKNQMLLRDDLEANASRVDELRKDVFDHEKRLIRLETLVEVARGNYGPRRLPPE